MVANQKSWQLPWKEHTCPRDTDKATWLFQSTKPVAKHCFYNRHVWICFGHVSGVKVQQTKPFIGHNIVSSLLRSITLSVFSTFPSASWNHHHSCGCLCLAGILSSELTFSNSPKPGVPPNYTLEDENWRWEIIFRDNSANPPKNMLVIGITIWITMPNLSQ